MQDNATHPQSPLASPRGVSGFWGLICGFLGGIVLFVVLILINALQTASLVLLPFSRQAFRSFNRACANTWWGMCVLASNYIYGIYPIVTGDDVPPKENAILVANHQQMPDIVALMMLAWSKSRLGDLKWFVKDVLKYVPGVGWGMLFLDCLFLKRNWDSDQTKIRGTFAKFRRENIPIWLISFSEGTRFKLKKLEKSRAYAHRQGLFEPKHTLVPRTKGFVASVIGLRDYVDAVYDITIGYEGGVPTLWQYTCGWHRRIHVHVRRFPIAQLPAADGKVADWLRARFVEKDALLEVFFRDGKFPSEMLSARELQPKNQPSLFPFVSFTGVMPEA